MELTLENKTIVLGVTGGIASYKTVELVSQLKKLGANVYVVLSSSAASFVSALSLEVISCNRVFTKDSKHTVEESTVNPFLNNSYIDHIHLAQIADIILIAPATANCIGKLAHAISDDLIYDITLATKAPVVIAPAMNTNMWLHPGVQDNIEKLRDSYAYSIIQPSAGALACKTSGIGRLADLDSIISTVNKILTKKILSKYSKLQFNSKGKPQNLLDNNILISAGGTKEYLDPVRFISNDSSGEMGFALAQEALYRGANVILVSTVNYKKDPIKSALLDHPNLLLLQVNSSEEMLQAMEGNFNESVDAVIMAAAVSDYSPMKHLSKKIKKDNNTANTVTLELKENPDIIKHLSSLKSPIQITVGFSLESEDLIENAQKKLIEKNLDMIVANGVDAINSKESEINIIYPKLDDPNELEIIKLIKQDKSLSADHILDHLSLILKSKHEKHSHLTDRQT
ncbi:MAG: bifunctional phosphopantothenoylcysteine decarboxylase/phosphopantothenate--cysteine ligase CoaBC [Candidatus Melainabacteria bacterium]|nr:bifunctional phosphopantothenoylcysteine decarboxylase/phosphopantothenate--cysteine ligase CoaBC [Candidatus Melainabacteria bacterium]